MGLSLHELMICEYMKDFFRQVAMWGLLVIGLLLVSISVNLYGKTIVEPWLPYGIALLLGVASIAVSGVWRCLTDTSRWWINALYGFAVVGALSAFAIIGGNYYMADESTAHTEEVKVVDKYREKHYKSRRVSRRVYTRGAPYWTYHVTVEFADGRRKPIEVTKKRYAKIKSGSIRELTLQKGLFGMPVVKGGAGRLS